MSWKSDCITMKPYLFRIILTGELWHLCQDIEKSFQENGFSLDMGRIIHITTTRFSSQISFQEIEQFDLLVKSAPILGTMKPVLIGLAAWNCDGMKLNLVSHERFIL